MWTPTEKIDFEAIIYPYFIEIEEMIDSSHFI